MEYNPSSCIVSAILCCVLASLASASNDFSEHLSALNIEERPCCKGNVIEFARECPSDQDKFALNCTDGISIERLGHDHIEIFRGIVQDEWFNYEAEYCTAASYHGSEVIVRCYNHNARESLLAFFFSKGIMMLISVPFLAATCYVYHVIPQLRDTQDRVTSIAITYLTMTMLLLGTRQSFLSDGGDGCESRIKGLVMYFCLFSYFAWSNVVMASVWKSTVAQGWNIWEKIWSIVIDYYAITVAVVCTGLALFVNSFNTFAVMTWWFKKTRYSDLIVSYIAYVPLTILLSISAILLAWIIYHLQGHEISAPDRKISLRYKCILYLRLFLLSGLTWIFEILSFYVFYESYNRSWFWLPIDAINCLQGILLFFVLVVCRPTIKRELADKRIFCFHCPANWGQPEDVDQGQFTEGHDGNEAERVSHTSPTIDA